MCWGSAGHEPALPSTLRGLFAGVSEETALKSLGSAEVRIKRGDFEFERLLGWRVELRPVLAPSRASSRALRALTPPGSRYGPSGSM